MFNVLLLFSETTVATVFILDHNDPQTMPSNITVARSCFQGHGPP